MTEKRTHCIITRKCMNFLKIALKKAQKNEFDSMSASFCFFFRFVGADLKSPNAAPN